MKTVIFSDSHHRHTWIDEILKAEEPYDKFIFLGDAFDRHGDNIEETASAAKWVKAKLDDPKNILIRGNHDNALIYPNCVHAQCSGFTREKWRVVHDILGDTINQLLPFCMDHDDGILFSHAGISQGLYEELENYSFHAQLFQVKDFLITRFIEANRDYLHNRENKLFACGYARGGNMPIGGITWQDFDDHLPIKGLFQVVGHSIQDLDNGPLFKFNQNKDIPYHWRLASKGVKTEWFENGATLCLDTCNRHYVVIENGAFTIKSINWIRQKDCIGWFDAFKVERGETICEFKLN